MLNKNSKNKDRDSCRKADVPKERKSEMESMYMSMGVQNMGVQSTGVQNMGVQSTGGQQE